MEDTNNDDVSLMPGVEHQVPPHCERTHPVSKIWSSLPHPRIMIDGLKAAPKFAHIEVSLISFPGLQRVVPDLIQVALRLNSELIHRRP